MGTQTAQLTAGQMKELVSALVEGVPAFLTPQQAQSLIGNKSYLHEWLQFILAGNIWDGIGPGTLRVDDILKFAQEHRGAVRRFAPGVLESVRALSGQFEQARMTTVPSGETLEFQRSNKVIKFWTDWHFKPLERERLVVSSTLGSEVIYLPGVVEGSLRCTFDKVEGRDCVQDILDCLPNVEGLRWIVGNLPTINRILANHLRGTGEYLLPDVYTWTDGIYMSPSYGLRRLVVGNFDSGGVDVNTYRPDSWGDVGLFVLGVPQDS